jgi:hypothetical protein
MDRSYARKAGISLRVATDPNWAMRPIAYRNGIVA